MAVLMFNLAPYLALTAMAWERASSKELGASARRVSQTARIKARRYFFRCETLHRGGFP
jgi:hypothetical protein